VDGKPRLDGVRDFLSSRGIELPEKSHEGDDTVEGIAWRKDTLIMRALQAGEVKVYEDSIAWLRQLRSSGIRTAVVSASRHCLDILQAAGINNLFDARVDGQVAEYLGLSGKPAPDTFLEAARILGVEPVRAVVVEDALAGVRAGRAGGFGLVIGVARGVSRMSLKDAGADVAINTLAEMMR
jgi:HAD superfamily hydrolase (TIGR01509 family)